MVDSRWLRRVGASLLAALVAGLLVYLVMRGATGIWLFVRQQQLLREVLGTVQGGLDAPPNGDLRALRRELQALDAQNDFVSAVAGFAAAAVAAPASYLWLERRAVLQKD